MTQQFYPLDKVFSPPMMDDGDPYEGLPESSTLTTHMIAGAAAGLGEHCIMYPFDCVKTRMQSLVPDPRANYRSVPDALVTIFRHEGLRSTMRGVQAVVGGAVPAHAMYFACYEQLKRVLSGGKQGNHLAHGVAGCAATLLHDAFMNPADVIKQRMQIYGSPHRSCRDCGKCLLKNEGMRAFYRSYTTQLSMNIPFQAVHFMMYEVMQDYLNPARRYDPVTHGMSGGVAGACAAIVTMPLDVCKTLLNTQEHCARTSVSSVEGMCSAFKTIYQFQGVSGYFRGLVARVCFQMPATAISWSVYEFFKYILSRKQPDDLQYLAIPIPHSVQAVTASKTHAENS